MEIILDFFTTGLVGDVVSWLWGQIKNVTGFIGAILAFWGLIDVYMLYRFRRADNIDKTAAVWNWFNLKWVLVSKNKEIAEKLPFLSKDLSEVVGVKEDDGRVT